MAKLILGGIVPVALLLTVAGCATTRPIAPVSTANPSARAYVRGVKDDAHRVDLEIRKLAVEVKLRGGIAETEMNFDLAAPAGSVGPVEGRLHVDLPPGAVITGYALDINGGMVDGSLVDQSKARSAYEQQVRKQADPGFTEVDQTSGFNTRIFPIDREHGRQVRLRFVAPVAAEYALPLSLTGKGGRLSIRVMQPGVRNPPAARMDGVAIRRTAGLAEGQATGPVSGTLRIAALPPADSLASRHASGEAYWQLAGPLPASAAAGGGALRIYWDRSRSRRDHDHQAELARIREAIAALHPTSIEWVAFSSGKLDRAAIASDNDLSQRVQSVRYGGATSFAALGSEAPAATCLLVSDGRVTFGPTLPPTLPCRVFAIAPSSAKLSALQAIADSSGARVVTGPSQPADWLQPSVREVVAGDRSVPFVSLPAPSGFWRVAIAAPSADRVVVRAGDEQFTRYGMDGTTRFDGEAALFAASQLARLEDPADRPRFVELSRRYSVASPTLSFVVLERPEDYVQYDIAPPANYTRRAEWAQLAAEKAEEQAEAKKDRFAKVTKEWKEQVAWWEKKFDITARPKTEEDRKGGRPGPVSATPVSRFDGPPPPPPSAPPPPPPPPPPPIAERDGDEAADVILTGSRVPSAPSDVQIAVAAWRPDRDYLDAYDADPMAFDRIFPDWDKKSGDVPAFYLDTADWLYRKGRTDLAVETLLSALDLPTANEVTLGMVAARLERYGAIDEAIALREKHALLDAEHPQPRRLLALALARRAELGGQTARADLEQAIGLLAAIALEPLDARWDGIDMISLVEANAMLVRLKAMGGSFALDPQLTRNLDSDVRVVIDWSSDAADIDLWVDQPNGERAIYRYPRTLIGGHLSNDMTSGFGPEEYFLRRAAAGRYTVRANAFAPDRLDPNGVSRVTAHLFRDWGRPGQREESIDLDLQRGQRGEIRIGTLKVEAPGK